MDQISKREYFAIRALEGLLAYPVNQGEFVCPTVCKLAVTYADELIKQLTPEPVIEEPVKKKTTKVK
jgi:hypothetical protein